MVVEIAMELSDTPFPVFVVSTFAVNGVPASRETSNILFEDVPAEAVTRLPTVVSAFTAETIEFRTASKSASEPVKVYVTLFALTVTV